MTCPSCGGELVPGAERCPVCEASVAPRVEGALAPDPRMVTPPARPKRVEPPMRELPGQRRRDKSWRDEVHERVRSRRQKRADSGLPLFDDAGTPKAAPAEVEAAPVPQPTAGVRYDTAPVEPPAELPPLDSVARRSHPDETLPPFRPAPAGPSPTRPSPRSIALPGSAPLPDHDLVSPGLSEAELADLPLHESRPAADLEALDRELAPSLTRELGPPPELPRQPAPTLDDDAVLDAGEAEPALELKAPVPEAPPLERPARAGERVQAAAVDLALFAALSAVVLYFAGRAARVDIAALLATSWQGLVAYLALLALFYAGYFSGTTGQTPGKLVTGLRVVDTNGRPPSYPRALARAVCGLTGIAAAGLGLLPIVFDPAGRALHDRLLRTRVVRR